MTGLVKNSLFFMSATFFDCCFQFSKAIARDEIHFDAYEMRM